MGSDRLGVIKSIEGVYGKYRLTDIEEIAKKAKIWTVWWNYTDKRTGTDTTRSLTPEDTGLTDQGREFIAMLSQGLRVAVDLSHASDKTSWDVLETVARVGGIPAIATHSGSREVFNHKRNLPDDLAKAIVAQDGIIGVPFTASFNGNLQGVLNTISHFRDLGLLDHIALGPDFDGMPQGRVIPELRDAEVAGPNLAAALRAEGYTEKDIRGVLFDNAFRYFQTHLFPQSKTA